MKGRCVICNTIGKLTRDHVPPRGVVPPRPVELRRLASVLEEGPSEPPGRPGFQAVDFPSLCAKCNVERLGQQYDPVLASFANDVAVRLRAVVDLGIYIPGDLSISTKPSSLARAVVGHLLAAEERKDSTEQLLRGTLIDSARSVFLDETASWPDCLHLACWPYLGKEQVILRGFGIKRVLGRGSDLIVGDLLKFYPVAFWLTNTDPGSLGYRFGTVCPDRSGPVDGEAIVRLPLRGRPHALWPERPRDDEMVLFSYERASIIRPTERRGK